MGHTREPSKSWRRNLFTYTIPSFDFPSRQSPGSLQTRLIQQLLTTSLPRGQASPAPPTPPQLFGVSTPQSTTVNQDGGYAADVNSAFTGGGGAHFFVWGRQLAQDVGQIAGMVSQYQPDYLLVEQGFNDMGWFISDAQGTLNNMVTFINNARSGNPNIKMAIANVSQRSFIGRRDDLITKTEDYNAALPGLLNSMYIGQSPIYLVQFRENYDCIYQLFSELHILLSCIADSGD